ncbi:cupredoxin domain-containing protein [Blastococcus atacamensis]|uniref:hypothetical protein n=1 Tax=Blastococcus atacamensis TaxID=2070508 RepID=UPI000CEC896B|nr:hypothetical protein [Blastococcus atacamensis]
MSRRVLAAALLPLSLVLAGCAGTEVLDAAGSSSAASSTSGGATEGSTAATTPAEPAGTALTVEVAGGQLAGDTGRVPVPLGDPVTVTITSDTADEVHLHGYDVTADLPAGTPVELSFEATIPGVFELELHDARTVLLTLQVS